jgi:formamidopyrimidine-DNA glycosylase
MAARVDPVAIRMPELPEVETTRRGVAPHVAGRRIARLVVYDSRLRWPVPASLARKIKGRTIDRVDRRSKYLLFRIGADTLIVHLGMTGSLRVHATQAPPRRAHDHVDLVLEDGTTLRYHDPRRFGAMLWAVNSKHALLADIGPEPLTPEFDADYLFRVTRGRKAAIKLVLMDNHVVAGVGNIYANEALFRAGVRPSMAAGRLSRSQATKLVSTVRDVLNEAIAKGGSTLRDYRGSGGEPGSFQVQHYVYDREGLPCRVCRTPIRAKRLGARSSFYCPACQR